MLDAPVSGSVPQVQSGTLTIMVGGDEGGYESIEPVLRELGTPTRVGENGQGLVLKLAINISLAVQMLAALAAGAGPTLVSGYHPDLDRHGHLTGVDSAPWRLAVEVLTKADEVGYEHRDIAGLYEVLGRMETVQTEAGA